MMRDTLDEQIEAFEALETEIRRRLGPVWVLVAGGELVETFATFADAARHARAHCAEQQVLIRHTDERKLETAPFLRLASEA